MATATGKKETIVKRSYSLEMNEEEAVTLIDALRAIGGDQVMSRRRHVKAIVSALVQAGVNGSWEKDGASTKDLYGSAIFRVEGF